MPRQHFDVMIIGAGLSGIDAAYHLQKLCPGKTYVILEQRERIGGTWDLFRYPGIRSDSDMLTMGYSFRPWTHPKAISPGEDIRNYVTSTAQEEGIDGHIRFSHQIKRVSWSSSEAMWRVEAERKLPEGRTETETLTCNFLFSCAGYYRYSSGHSPEFPNASRFKGRIVHPQLWPEDLDYSGKRVAIIGSGATAVTLVPSMAQTASHVTMLQRSPTYVISMPDEDRIANWLRRILPVKLAYRLGRWKNVGFMTYFYQFAQFFPDAAKRGILRRLTKHLEAGYDIDTHFTPSYKPWEQRMCLVPNADMFEAIKSNRAAVVTDHIETFTEKGILLRSGKELEADIIVTATGLVMQAFGGAEFYVDGQHVDLGQTLTYKGIMLSDVPNFASVFGYINASWTLKADLICDYVCRLLNFMDRKGTRQVMPKRRGEIGVSPFVEKFTPGYMQRALASWPKQGSDWPWRANQNYLRDSFGLKWTGFDDGVLEFSNPSPAPSQPASQQLPSVPTRAVVR